MEVLSRVTPPRAQVAQQGHRQIQGSFLWWGVPALFDTVELSLSTCLWDSFAAGLQLKHFTFTWQFLTQNNLTCNFWLHSLHLVPACNCCTFSSPGRGMPRQSQSTAASSEQLSQCPQRLAIATSCPCRLCLGRCPQPAVALGSISAACQ